MYETEFKLCVYYIQKNKFLLKNKKARYFYLAFGNIDFVSYVNNQMNLP